MRRKNKMGLLCMIVTGILLIAFSGWVVMKQQRSSTYVFLLNSSKDSASYVEGFQKEMQQTKKEVKILSVTTKAYSSLQQYQLLQDHVKKGTKCIVINAATKANLSELLPKYRKEGIRIISAINEVNELQRDLHVGIVDPVETGNEMMEEVYALTGGKGNFIIISDSMQGSMSNGLLKGIRECYEKKNPKELYMDDILRAPETKEEVLEKFQEYLKEKKNTAVILCLTPEITEIACEAVKNCEMEEQITIIGLSTKTWLEQNKEYFGKLHIRIYYYDDEKYGQYLAQIAEKITEEKISCTPGTKICLSDGTVCEIMENANRTKEDPIGVEAFLFEKWQYFEKNIR